MKLKKAIFLARYNQACASIIHFWMMCGSLRWEEAGLAPFLHSLVCNEACLRDFHEQDYRSRSIFTHHFGHEAPTVCVRASHAESWLNEQNSRVITYQAEPNSFQHNECWFFVTSPNVEMKADGEKRQKRTNNHSYLFFFLNDLISFLIGFFFFFFHPDLCFQLSGAGLACGGRALEDLHVLSIQSACTWITLTPSADRSCRADCKIYGNGAPPPACQTSSIWNTEIDR